MRTIESIRDEVNRRAVGRPIGEIQHLRKRLKSMQRLAARVVFGPIRGITRLEGSDNAELNGELPYTYHIGGREELQFNIGIDPFDNLDLRYGVAFSFETSISYPSIEPLLPRVQLFNDYLREHQAQFANLWMWHYSNQQRSERRRPEPLTPDIVQVDNFVFIGALGRSEEPDYDAMLDTFDRLLPIWQFIEENIGGHEPAPAVETSLRRGRPQRLSFTRASLAQRLLDINLRHNVLQAALVNELIDEFGEEAVGWEQPAPGGGSIDALVVLAGTRILFEIKTAATARGCVREAMGQLLDYGCWPGTPAPTRLVVVGEPEPDAKTTEYLAHLSTRFPAPITYRCIRVPDEND